MRFRSLRAVTTLKDFEALLGSGDVNAMRPAIAFILGFPSWDMQLPIRWKVEEIALTVSKLGIAAKEKGVVPRNVLADTQWYDRTRHGKAVEDFDNDAWDTRHGSAPIATPQPKAPRTLDQRELDAIKYLEGAGLLNQARHLRFWHAVEISRKSG